MNYRRIYTDIVNNAKADVVNRTTGYFEKHHILPKSLGGCDTTENLVKLTAKEHFICHWLLVKMYDKGTIERKKMLYALWRMQSINDCHKRYVNSRVYEQLRIEFASIVSEKMSENQSGSKNSRYGTKWYTSYVTGESTSFTQAPDSTWILGRNLFRHESSSLYSVRELENMQKAKNAWDEYHSGNYSSIRDYCRQTSKFTQPNLTALFKKYVPISRKLLIGRSHNNKSNKNLVGVYE